MIDGRIIFLGGIRLRASRLRVKNLVKTRRKLIFGLLLSGRGRNSEGKDYAWSVPEVPTDCFHLRDRNGLHTGISKGSIPNSLLFQSKDEHAAAAERFSLGSSRRLTLL